MSHQREDYESTDLESAAGMNRMIDIPEYDPPTPAEYEDEVHPRRIIKSRPESEDV